MTVPGVSQPPTIGTRPVVDVGGRRLVLTDEKLGRMGELDVVRGVGDGRRRQRTRSESTGRFDVIRPVHKIAVYVCTCSMEKRFNQY